MILFITALAVLAAGGLASLAASRRPRLALAVATASAVLGCALGLAASFHVLVRGASTSLRIAWPVPGGALHLKLDPLTAFFAVALFGLGVPASVFGYGYMRPHLGRRSLGIFLFFYDLLLAAIALVLAAHDAVLFLVAWEVMSLASFFLVTFEHDSEEVRSAGWTYLVASHLGTAFLFALFLVLSRGAGSFDFERIAVASGSAGLPAAAVFALAVVGFGTKAGLVPLHVWLPEAHPAAPSHVSALMSGVMIKTGIYGVLRVLALAPPPPAVFGLGLAAAGLVGALVALALAIGQRDLKRALAYSSVENVALIAVGLGLGLAGSASGLPAVAALGFGGALLHVWNHAAMKGLAFLGAGAIVHAAHTRDLERMGGLLRRLPRTGALFLVAAAALAAMPPLNGFVSEWLVYLGLLGAARSAGGGLALTAYLGIAALAVVGGLAVVTFVRIAGVALLGEPRSQGAAGAVEPPATLIGPLAALALACVALALAPDAALALAGPVLDQIVPGTALRPALAAAAQLAAPFRVVAGALVVGGVLLVLLGRRLRRGRDVGSSATWGCGFSAPTPRMQYTAASFAELEVRALVPHAIRPWRRARLPKGVFPAASTFALEAQDPARTRLFGPLFDALARRFSGLRRFQQNRLNLQLLYTVLALLAVAGVLAIRRGLP